MLTCGLINFTGGNVIAQPVHNVMFSKTGILSPTGSSKSFDAAADGYARYIFPFNISGYLLLSLLNF